MVVKKFFSCFHDAKKAVNSQYVVEFINPALEKELGPLNGKKCYEYFLNRSEPCPECANISIFEGKTLRQEFFSSKINKKFEITSTPLYNPDGSISKLGIFYDITKRKEAEQKLKESEKKLKNERDNLINILNSMEDGVYIVSPNYDIEYINPTVKKEFGSPKNKKCYEYAYTRSEPCPWCKLSDILDGNTIRSERFFDINQKIYDVIDTPLRNIDGTIFKLKLLRDITEKKEAERLIIEENVKLMELSQMRQDLITRISHELKTPLTSIYGVSQAFLEIPREELNEDILEYIDISHRGCLRLKELIDNLLDASRLDSKRFELKIHKENLVELIKDCINDMKYLVNSRKHTLITDLPKELVLDFDKLRLSQVITNLISNAINNTPIGGKIFISTNETREYIDIQVNDNGVGLTKKEKEKLFQKFGKIERYGKGLEVDIEGAGLGLYISKEIVDLHGGQILVESKGRNKGATFTIRLYKNK